MLFRFHRGKSDEMSDRQAQGEVTGNGTYESSPEGTAELLNLAQDASPGYIHAT
jgi:hypothetical protein